MNGIGKEEVVLCGIIALCGLTGVWVRSCNNASIADKDIALKQHEYGYVWNDTCNPGEIPSYKDIGNPDVGRRIFFFCSCPEKKEPSQ